MLFTTCLHTYFLNIGLLTMGTEHTCGVFLDGLGLIEFDFFPHILSFCQHFIAASSTLYPPRTSPSNFAIYD